MTNKSEGFWEKWWAAPLIILLTVVLAPPACFLLMMYCEWLVTIMKGN